jgi:hypothetical protein
LDGKTETVLVERARAGHGEGFAPVRFDVDIPDGALVKARLGAVRDGVVVATPQDERAAA